MITGLHHVGQIVEDDEAALALYRDVLYVSVVGGSVQISWLHLKAKAFNHSATVSV